jgi:hypothetical protein
MLRMSYNGGRALHMYTPEIANPEFRQDQPYYRIVPFPVKTSWKDQGDLAMIVKSTQMLVELLRLMPEPHDCVVPQVGCGYGELRPEVVIPAIEPILGLAGDRVIWLEPDPEIFKKYTTSFAPGFRSDRTAVEANRPCPDPEDIV